MACMRAIFVSTTSSGAMDSLPITLYKYLTSDAISVLATQQLRYTPLCEFNDPFEGRPHISRLASEEETREMFRRLIPAESKRTYDSFPSEIRAHLSATTFTELVESHMVEPDTLARFEKYLPFVRDTILNKFDELIGVFSLSEVPDSLLMWAHYARSHTGFVLAFDSKHTYFNEAKSPNDEFRHLRRVVYRNARPGGPLTSLDGVDVFLVKSEQWDYEREWRVLRPLSEATTIDRKLSMHLFKFPTDALKEIIFGARISDQLKSELINLVRADTSLQHLRLRQSLPHDEHFMLRFVDVTA